MCYSSSMLWSLRNGVSIFIARSTACSCVSLFHIVYIFFSHHVFISPCVCFLGVGTQYLERTDLSWLYSTLCHTKHAFISDIISSISDSTSSTLFGSCSTHLRSSTIDAMWSISASLFMQSMISLILFMMSVPLGQLLDLSHVLYQCCSFSIAISSIGV